MSLVVNIGFFIGKLISINIPQFNFVQFPQLYDSSKLSSNAANDKKILLYIGFVGADMFLYVRRSFNECVSEFGKPRIRMVVWF